MKVAAVRLLCFRIPFKAVFESSAGPAAFREGIILQLQTDSGITGLGEASFLPKSAEPFSNLKEEAQRQAKAAIGLGVEELIEDQRECHALGERAARSGLAIAAWDAAARDRNLPLAEVLSPAPL